MKTYLFSAIALTVVTLVFFSGIYTAVVWVIAQAAPNQGKGETVEVGNQRYYTHIGQAFTEDIYFNSRPSAVDYNAAGSAGSNKGPTNPEYLDVVKARIDTFLVHNPGIRKPEIPAELVTASGSGLDPDISPKAALVQIKRIAATRHIPGEILNRLVVSTIEKPLFGLFGPERINLLTLNLALDQLKQN